MIVKIVGAGNDSFSKIYKESKNEFIIGCDGGCETLDKLGLNYDLALGDFDSFDINNIKKCVQIKKLNPIKDQSDLEVAINYAINLKPERIEIYNATGKRQDHFYALITLLKKLRLENIYIIDEYNKIYLSSSNDINTSYHYISFFSLADDTFITLKGFKYELDNYNLQTNDPLCLSNEIKVSGTLITNKQVLVIESN